MAVREGILCLPASSTLPALFMETPRRELCNLRSRNIPLKSTFEISSLDPNLGHSRASRLNHLTSLGTQDYNVDLKTYN